MPLGPSIENEIAVVSQELTLWEVIAASTDTCEPRKYPDAERRRDTYAAHKYPEMRQLLPISALIVPLVH